MVQEEGRIDWHKNNFHLYLSLILSFGILAIILIQVGFNEISIWDIAFVSFWLILMTPLLIYNFVLPRLIGISDNSLHLKYRTSTQIIKWIEISKIWTQKGNKRWAAITIYCSTGSKKELGLLKRDTIELIIFNHKKITFE